MNELATLGGGCFWCVEAIFKDLAGVNSVEPGYAGGHVDHPTYQQVCAGTTGHAEVCRVSFDPQVVSYATLLEVFFKTHDPTTLNRQGNDVGPQYRSSIFTHSDEQANVAQTAIKALSDAAVFRDPIVTTIEPISNYYPAEDYHRDYFANNPGQPYCAAVVGPKVEKFRKMFREQLRGN